MTYNYTSNKSASVLNKLPLICFTYVYTHSLYFWTESTTDIDQGGTAGDAVMERTYAQDAGVRGVPVCSLR